MTYIESMFSCKNQRVVITGGAGVIAQSLAAGFLQAGARVSLWGRSAQTLEETRRALVEATHGDESALALEVVDCTDKSALEHSFENSTKLQGLPSVLVNCVGGNKGKVPFVQQDAEAFKEVLELNLMAGLLLPSQIFVKAWQREGKGGSIINFASMAAYQCFSGVWAYDAAKAGVLNLTKGMAKEFASLGIRVNSISPGFFLGKQNKALLVEKDEPYTLTARGKQVIERTSMARFGNHRDLQGAALFLASSTAAGFVTGVDIPVDGGFLADSI